jgi:hypothetical protein
LISTLSRIFRHIADNRYAGYAVLAIGFAVRFLTVYFNPVSNRLYSDMGDYSHIADDLLAGIWRPRNFFRPIGFPYLEYAFKSLFADQWAQAFGVYQSVVTTAALWFMWKAAEKTFGRRVGFAALLVGTFHIQWLAFNLFALSDNTFAFLLAVLLWVSVKVIDRQSYLWSALWGVVFITAFWIKGTHVFVGPVFVAGVLLWKRLSWRAIARIAAPIGSMVALGLLLHGLLTYRTIGSFQITASVGGLNFVEGKCRIKRQVDSEGAVWISPLYVQLDMFDTMEWPRPFTDSRYFTEQAMRCIWNDPAVLVTSFENIPFLFINNFAWPISWPLHELSVRRYIRLYELFFAIFLVPGLLVWLRSRWPLTRNGIREMLVWGAPILGLFLCVYVFKSETRYRVPFDVYFIPVAIEGWRQIRAMRRELEPAAPGDWISNEAMPSAH